VPELPELEVLREYLTPRLEGRTIAQVWTSPKLSFLLRAPLDDFARQLTGSAFERAWRRGKFLIFDIGGQHLVINPMLGGRFQWTTAAAKVQAATVFRLTLDNGDELRFLDTVKMGRVYWVSPGCAADDSRVGRAWSRRAHGGVIGFRPSAPPSPWRDQEPAPKPGLHLGRGQRLLG